MFKTASKGGWNELSVGAELVRLGCPVSFPYGGGSRYDLIVDIRGELFKVQCKTSRRVKDGVYQIALRSTHRSGKKTVTLKYSSDEIDMYATVIDDNVLLIPIKAIRSTTVATIYKENKDDRLSIDKFLARKLVGYENILDAEKCREIRNKNKRKVRSWVRRTSRVRTVPNIPSPNELEQMIKDFPLWKIAKMNHISKRRIWQLVEQYGLDIKRGIDPERIRKRGSYESSSKKLTEYYASHISTKAKKVVQYASDGSEVARYDSTMIAAKKTGFKGGQIKRVCLRKRKRYQGFIWRHEGDSFI